MGVTSCLSSDLPSLSSTHREERRKGGRKDGQIFPLPIPSERETVLHGQQEAGTEKEMAPMTHKIGVKLHKRTLLVPPAIRWAIRPFLA